MEDIEIRKCTIEDLRELNYRAEQLGFKNHVEFEKHATKMVTEGPCYSGFLDGKLVGCAGVCLFWPGVGEAWVAFAPEVLNLRKEAYHYVGDYLQRIMDEHNLRRVQATANTQWTLAIKYLENLGFKREGILRKYDPFGNDHYMYALIKGE